MCSMKSVLNSSITGNFHAEDCLSQDVDTCDRNRRIVRRNDRLVHCRNLAASFSGATPVPAKLFHR